MPTVRWQWPPPSPSQVYRQLRCTGSWGVQAAGVYRQLRQLRCVQTDSWGVQTAGVYRQTAEVYMQLRCTDRQMSAWGVHTAGVYIQLGCTGRWLAATCCVAVVCRNKCVYSVGSMWRRGVLLKAFLGVYRQLFNSFFSSVSADTWPETAALLAPPLLHLLTWGPQRLLHYSFRREDILDKVLLA